MNKFTELKEITDTATSNTINTSGSGSGVNINSPSVNNESVNGNDEESWFAEDRKKNKRELFEFLNHLEERKKRAAKIGLAYAISVFVAVVLILFVFTSVNIKNYIASVSFNLLLCLVTSIIPISLFYYLAHSSKAESTTEKQYAISFCLTLTFYVVLVTIAVPLITYTGQYSLRTWWMCVTANFYNGSITDDITKISDNHYLNLSGTYIYPPNPDLSNIQIGQTKFKCEHDENSYKLYCAIALVGINYVNSTPVTIYTTCETDCDQQSTTTCQDLYQTQNGNEDTDCFTFWKQHTQGGYAFVFVRDLDEDEDNRVKAAEDLNLKSSNDAMYGMLADKEFVEYVEEESITLSAGFSVAVFSITFLIFLALIALYYYYNIWRVIASPVYSPT